MPRSIKTPMDIPKENLADSEGLAPEQIAAIGETKDAQLVQALYRRVEQLENERKVNSQIFEAIHDLVNRYRALIENIPDLIYSLDEWGVVQSVNKVAHSLGYSPEEVVGRSFLEFVHPEDHEHTMGTYLEAMASRRNKSETIQFRMIAKSGEIRWMEAHASAQFNQDGKLVVHEGVARDITEIINKQNALIKGQEVLEAQVQLRTKELLQINAELQQQINERLAVEKVLLEREGALEMEKANLKEANTALRVLLKRREMDKQALEEQVLYNVKKLVIPYLNKLQKEISNEKHKIYLGIIESNLIDITCGFSRRLSFEFYGLSTSELKVANFIRQGKKTREIAEVLGLSARTVEAVRQSIRHKLRLQNKKVNLRTFLMSIN